jgi:uncharacterized membrane protein
MNEEEIEQTIADLMELRHQIRGLQKQQDDLRIKMAEVTHRLQQASMSQENYNGNTIGKIAGHISQNNES